MFAVEAFATGGESNYIYIGCYIGNYYQQRSQIYGDMIGICGWSFGQAWCFFIQNVFRKQWFITFLP
jgi:hypothetical protein